MKDIEAAVLTAAISETHGLTSKPFNILKVYTGILPVSNSNAEWQDTVIHLRDEGVVRLFNGCNCTRPVLRKQYRVGSNK